MASGLPHSRQLTTLRLLAPVGWVRALKAEPRGYFEQAAIAGVRSWRFRPARAGGETIECRLVTRVRFALVDTVGEATKMVSDRTGLPGLADLLAEQADLQSVLIHPEERLTVLPLGAGGAVDVFVNRQTHVIIDVNGYFTGP